MQEIIVNTLPNSLWELERFVTDLNINVYYIMPKKSTFKSIKVQYATSYFNDEPYYCWVMEYNYEVTGSVGYAYPLASTQIVKHFKTEKGVKRNLFKRLAHSFKKEAKENLQPPT